MNDWDKDNLRFIMNKNSVEFNEWMEQACDDDLQYAQELIRAAKAEIALQVAQLCDEVEDLSEAKAVLGKFTLG